jgi:hypothetical protein
MMIRMLLSFWTIFLLAIGGAKLPAIPRSARRKPLPAPAAMRQTAKAFRQIPH